MEYNGAGKVVSSATHTGSQERLAIEGELGRDLTHTLGKNTAGRGNPKGCLSAKYESQLLKISLSKRRYIRQMFSFALAYPLYVQNTQNKYNSISHMDRNAEMPHSTQELLTQVSSVLFFTGESHILNEYGLEYVKKIKREQSQPAWLSG